MTKEQIAALDKADELVDGLLALLKGHLSEGGHTLTAESAGVARCCVAVLADVREALSVVEA